VGEPHPRQQLVPCLHAQRLRLAAVVKLGSVDPLEPKLHAPVDLRGNDAAVVLELRETLGVIGDEPDRVPVRLFALDDEVSRDRQKVGRRHTHTPRRPSGPALMAAPAGQYFSKFARSARGVLAPAFVWPSRLERMAYPNGTPIPRANRAN